MLLFELAATPTASDIRELQRPAQAPKGNVLLGEIDGNAYRSKLEKHIEDHESGHGHLSRPMYAGVERRKEETALKLGEQHPKSFGLFAGYLTAGFSYDKEARFVSGVRSAVTTSERIGASLSSLDVIA
ncbi:MAG: hypothetical protein KDD69_19955 [Bdellovibrionales bacterium]|nr:hypothetical protein [Bdellovibrionales bacterium]